MFLPGIEFQQPAGLADHAYPFVIKNNIVYTHQASFPYFMGFFHGQLPAILQASDHNFLYRPEFPGEARFVDLGPTRLALGQRRPRYGHDVHTIVGKDPRFANPVGLPAPATIEEARARLKPAPGSPACTAGGGGTHVGAVPCGGSPGKPLGD